MKINKKRIKNIDKIISIIDTDEFYIISKTDKIKKLGFKNLEIGETIVPSGVGPISKFNKYGKEEIIIPKTKEVVRHNVPYNITDWHGNSHSGICSKKYKRLKRKFVPPFKEKVIIKDIMQEKYIISTRLISKKDSKIIIKHLINLMLEMFGVIEIIDVNNNPVIATKRVPWKILPPGDMPWEVYYKMIQNKVENYNKKEILLVKDRYNFIKKLNPTSIICGEEGFLGYFIAEIKENFYICDSIFLGNAIYILETNWRDISKLTKKEIINNKLATKRIIHRGNWKSKVLLEIKNKKIKN